MCGITYFENKKASSVAKSIKKRFHKQRSRGTQGFGFVSYDLDKGKIEKFEQFATETATLKELETITSNACLFHHRHPTSTPNVAEAAHPILVKNKRLEFTYYVVHNGIISNASYLKGEHEKLGYKYTTEIQKLSTLRTRKNVIIEKDEVVFNDSEALAVELAELIEGKKTTCDARGSMAFVVLQAKKGKVVSMYFGRNDDNPLKAEGNDMFFGLKSEGNGREVPSNLLFRRDPFTREIRQREVEFMSMRTTPTTPATTSRYNKDTGKWEEEDKTHRRVVPDDLDMRCLLCDDD